MPSTYSLAELLHPITKETFLEEYWEKKPLLVKRDDAQYYSELLTRGELDRVITTMHPKFPDVQIVNANKELQHNEYCYPNDLIDVARVYQEFADGGTIVLANLEGYLGSIAAFCRSLEQDMSARFQSNIYLTPEGSKGFKRHWDGHDVFVVQVEGCKHWKVYDTQVVLPLKGERFDPEQATTDAECTMDFVLEPGDVFYLPRGVMHDAVTEEGHSLHITVGMFCVSWVELFMEAIAKVGTTDAAFRRSLPAAFARPGFDREPARAVFEELMRVVVDRVDFDGSLDHFADDLISTRHSLLTGQLEQVLKLPSLTLDSMVGVRPNLLWHLRKTDEHVSISCYGGQTTLPIHAADPLEFALHESRFAVRDLPGELDDDGKKVLVDLLVREGLLHFL